jgi:dTDP-4-dehydrorhamnose reductase
LANYLLLGIQNETLKKGISHYSDGEAMTWLDLAKRIVRENNLTSECVSRDQSLTNTKRPKKTVI